MVWEPSKLNTTHLWRYIEGSVVPHPQNQGLTDPKLVKLPQFNVNVWKMGEVRQLL